MDCKKRSANFNVKEESLLVALVKKYREILECKLTDMRTHNEKAECWAKIEVEFNGASGEAYRPKDVLRKKYDNIKKRVKKKYSDEKCHLRGTGGGPPQKIKFTDIDVEIKEILGVRIEGNESEFDGDADVHNLDSDMQNVEVEVPFEDHDYTVPASSSNNGVFETVATLKKNDDCNSSCTVSNASTSWAKYTPKMLRAKKSQCLQAGGNDAVSDICTFAQLKNHYVGKENFDTNLFAAETRPAALQALYDAATKTPVHLMRQLDRWRRDGHRTSRFFLCTPVLGAKRRKIRNRVDIDIETRMPAAVEELRRWTSDEALGDITVTPDCASRIAPNITMTDGDATDGTIVSDDEGIDHKLPSPEEQLQVVALKFPAEIVAVDISGRSFDRMSIQRRSLLCGDVSYRQTDGNNSIKRKTRSRRPRSRRRNTLAGTDQKEIQDALTAGEEPSSPIFNHETESPSTGVVCRSKSSDILRSLNKKESPENKKSHFNTLKQWGKNRYDRFMNRTSESKNDNTKFKNDVGEESNHYETVNTKRKRDLEKERKSHERNSSISSSEKSSINVPVSNTLSSVINIAVKLRESSAQRRQRRTGGNKDEPHSSSGNWSASSESGRASIGSEITTTTHPKSTTSTTTSSNSLNQQPSSVNSRRRFNVNTSTSSSVTSEGTLTPDIIHDLHEDGETSSVYSCDTEGYYTSFHMDSGLKTLKEEDSPPTPLHSTSAFSNSSSNNTVLSAENEYELFGKGSTSTTTSSAGTVCTTLRASESSKSLIVGPAVPERKSSLSKLSTKSPESSLERDFSDKTGTVKRSPANTKPIVVALVHKETQGDISPDSGHNTSSSPIESINSPNGVRSSSDFEFSESSDMEGSERIERIRIKTAINSSRIPSMCVITPPHSDEESENSNSSQNNYQKQLMQRNSVNRKTNTKDADCPDTDKVNEINNKENSDIQKRIIRTNINGCSKISLINVNPQSGYATVETFKDQNVAVTDVIVKGDINQNTTNVFTNSKPIRTPSPSGGTLIVKETKPLSKAPTTQPTIKASLIPLNNVIGKLKTNIANFAQRRDRSTSPNSNKNQSKITEDTVDSGEYVTIADIRNNNQRSQVSTEHNTYSNDINTNLNTVLSGAVRDSEYICLNELPCNENKNALNTNQDSLERKRQGARVMLDAEGKVVYSSDSLRRRKGAHTTFEPGPYVKPTSSPNESPLPIRRATKSIRPVQNSQNQMVSTVPSIEFSRPLSPKSGKLIIRASSGISSPTTEIVRMPPSTIVTPTVRPMSPRSSASRGAYVHIQDAGRPLSPTHEKERVPSPANQAINLNLVPGDPHLQSVNFAEMYTYRDPLLDQSMDTNRYLSSQYYFKKGSPIYSTLPSKKTQFFNSDIKPERSVTPDITRGLERNYNTNDVNKTLSFTSHIYEENIKVNHQHSLPRNFYKSDQSIFNQKMGIPVQVPNVDKLSLYKVPFNDATSSTPVKYKILDEISTHPKPHYGHAFNDTDDSFKISPIDPRHSNSFQSSTPSSKNTELRAAKNLENKLLSPKKSTMSNEELYAVIHKSKKKMNIEINETPKASAETVQDGYNPKQSVKSPETGYLDKSRSRLSWSPSKGEYVDFNSDIDKLSPPNNSRSRQSWACSDRKNQKTKQTSTIDFKRLLLQKCTSTTPKKLSAVEQLKLSKQQIKSSPQKSQSEMDILDLSGSPRSLVNRRYFSGTPGSPIRESKPAPKVLSPRSQWRFANPRSDVLSSTILEDCREDESPNSSVRKKQSSSESEFEINKCHNMNDNLSEGKSGGTEIKPYTSTTERLHAQRAQFFNSATPIQNSSQINQIEKQETKEKLNPPTLETAF